MPELIKATSSAISDALRGDEHARAFADRLKSIMRQLGDDTGAKVVVEMQNHLISLCRGQKIDRYAAVALMILVAQNSIADWIVGDELGPISVEPSDPRVVAVEAVQRLLLHESLRERSADRISRQLSNGHAKA